MKFSERHFLQEEYYKWLATKRNDTEVNVADCPANVMVFLEKKGLLLDPNATKSTTHPA